MGGVRNGSTRRKPDRVGTGQSLAELFLPLPPPPKKKKKSDMNGRENGGGGDGGVGGGPTFSVDVAFRESRKGDGVSWNYSSKDGQHLRRNLVKNSPEMNDKKWNPSLFLFARIRRINRNRPRKTHDELVVDTIDPVRHPLPLLLLVFFFFGVAVPAARGR